MSHIAGMVQAAGTLWRCNGAAITWLQGGIDDDNGNSDNAAVIL